MLCCVTGNNAATQDFSIFITGDFESQCILPNEGSLYVDEFPHVMVACQDRQVTYTAWFSVQGETAVSWNWTVTGAASYTFTDNVAQVIWGNSSEGEIYVTVTTSLGREIPFYQRVGLIENPVVAAATVPTCSTDHEIYVCMGESVEFTDQSQTESSDIVGYYWEGCGATASTHSFTLDNIVQDCYVTHRVYNNCGCYDEETFIVHVLDGDPLRIDCYGTACEGSTVSYHASSPSCENEYLWAVEGGTVVSGQHTTDFTVLWDNPQDGYGIISLDGVKCAGEACQNKLSVKIPIIQNGMHISGQTSVCEGEAVIYSVPLYGSTRYEWTITPSILPVLINNANQIEYIFHVADTYRVSVKYKCDFLSCGEFYSDTLTVVVKPRLSITGENEICLTNPCSLSTSPTALATWEITDLDDNQQVYTSTAPEANVSITFSNAGRYRVTAHNNDYCNEAVFFLTVKDAPPAPTSLDMDPDNPTVACIYSSIPLKAHLANPEYSVIWEPVCTTATPASVSGNDVTITYAGEVCNVYAYTYDRRLQCRSAGHYTQSVSQFALAQVDITSPITVCPGSVITWGNDEVPYQENVIYEWEIEELKQYCATVVGDKFSNGITLNISNFNPLPTLPLSFYINLYRTYCSGLKDTTTIQIIIDNLSNATLGIVPENHICQYTEATFIGSGCGAGTYLWNISGDPATYQGGQLSYTFNHAGNATVEMRCNPYDACSNPDYMPSVTTNVIVNPAPPVSSIGYDGTDVYIIPPLSTTDYSFQWGHTNINSNIVPAAPGVTSYSCTVTNIVDSRCTVDVYNMNVTLCKALTIEPLTVPTYCNYTASFEVLNPPSTIIWDILGGSHGTPVYSGTNNEIVTFTVNSVGSYVVVATADDGRCYRSSRYFIVDFVPFFTFEKNCTSIVIHNHSRYLDGTKLITLSVNGTPLTPFPANQQTITYNTGTGGTFTFQLTGYDGIPLNCPLETVTISNSSNSLVAIETANTGNPSQTCNNTPLELTATIASPHTISSSHWEFDDNNTYLDVVGNSVFHTFATRNYQYGVNVAVIDENGCTSNGSINITSNNNILKDAQLQISSSTPITCPGNNRVIEYLPVLLPPETATYTWSTPPSPNGQRVHNVTYTDDYDVVVTNAKYCKTMASVNVPFLNKPTAIIIPEKYYYCSGETIKLFGAPDNSNNNQYQWNVVNSVTSEVSTCTTGTMTFPAPDYHCDFTVNLTVTDLTSHCSATADPVTISVVPPPAAPTIDINSNYNCIHTPPVVMDCNDLVNEIHWSNGSNGNSAYYYYPGPVTAYYYDMTSGCRSQQGEYLIPSAPDFDALLTGCYKVCPALADDPLPAYGLLPVWQAYGWEWFYNYGYSSNAGYATSSPIYLPLHGYDTYWLDVQYNGACNVTSKPLVLEEDTICKCDGITVSYDY